MGINLKVLSITKSKNVLKVSRANATTHFLTDKDVILVIYEEAFDRLSDEFKNKLMEGAISNISYDTEKDKIIVGAPQIVVTVGGRMKYGEELINAAEIAVTMIQEIEEEKKAQKEAEKAAKKAKKNG